MNKSPFVSLSAEEEKDYLKDIFYKQHFYDDLVALAKSSSSRFILGQRGQGKSAILLHLFKDLKQLDILPILIDQYDGFPEKDNENYFLHAMIARMTFELAERIMENPKLLKKLDATQKQMLYAYIEMFYDQRIAAHCVNYAKTINAKRVRNKIRTFINNHASLFNKFFSATTQAGVEVIKQMTNLGNLPIPTNIDIEWLSELKLESVQQISMDIIVTWKKDILKQMLQNLINMAVAMDINSVVIMFDKIDEIANINGQIEKVATFLLDVLSDTHLLYLDHLSIMVGLWSEAKKALNKQGIRFDKFQDIDIQWTNEELINLLNKRLFYFSNDKSIAPTFDTIIPDKVDQEQVLLLADKSPRAFINILGCILSEENPDKSVVAFSKDALAKGYVKFSKKFDYTSAIPARVGKSSDILLWIMRLLRMRKASFSINEYMEVNMIKSNTAATHIDTLLRLNLIKENKFQIEKEITLYEITDPRICFLISRGEQELDN